MRWLRNERNSIRLLFESIEREDLPQLKHILRTYEFHPQTTHNEFGENTLQYACYFYNKSIIQYLLEQGADPYQSTQKCNMPPWKIALDTDNRELYVMLVGHEFKAI